MRLDTNEQQAAVGEGHSETGSGVGILAAERGISEGVLSAAGIRLSDSDDRRHRGWWVLPYPHRTGVWKVRYRNPDPEGRPKYLDDTGAVFRLYNPLRLGPGEEEVWFTEGEFDCLALVDAGLKAIGIHGVSNVPAEEGAGDDRFGQPAGFKHSWKLLFEDTLVITMFDDDDAGRKAGRRLAAALNGVAFDGWGDSGFTDVNDWWRSDPAGMVEAINNFRVGVRRSRGLDEGR